MEPLLKIRLDNPDESAAIERLLRDLIQQDRSYVAGFIKGLVDAQMLSDLSGQDVIASVVQGQDITGEIYFGLILHDSGRAAERNVIKYKSLSIFLEKPFVFSSVQDATKIWPHQTLEDRLIDATLFALAGYTTPRTAKLVSVG